LIGTTWPVTSQSNDIQSILSSYHFDIELMDDCITPRWLIMNAALVRAFARAGFTIVDTGYRPPASPLHLSLAPLLDLDPQATGQFPEIMSGFRDTSQ
jgi:hypothetical protein